VDGCGHFLPGRCTSRAFLDQFTWDPYFCGSALELRSTWTAIGTRLAGSFSAGSGRTAAQALKREASIVSKSKETEAVGLPSLCVLPSHGLTRCSFYLNSWS